MAQPPAPILSPQALGFQHYYKCPVGDMVKSLGDTGTPQACLAACLATKLAASCWWLDGTGSFPRECRACQARAPEKMAWPNDWAVPLSGATS